MNWDQLVSRIAPFVVRIDTPDGSGTGFLCLYNENRQWIGIATAAHVVSHAEQWQQPIRIWTGTANTTHLFQSTHRVILTDWNRDSAVLLLPNNLGFTQQLIPLLPASSSIPIGASVGWLGYPTIAMDTMCFFRGTISAVEMTPARAYLIDGVAINGVSGGPVIHFDRTTNEMYIVGILAAYRANRQYGESLPGLSIAQDVSHFHTITQTVRDIEDAERTKREFQQLMNTLPNT